MIWIWIVTTASGSPASLVLPPPHQSKVQTERHASRLKRLGGERDCCRLWTPGQLTSGAVVQQELSSGVRTGDNPFLLHVAVQCGPQGVKHSDIGWIDFNSRIAGRVKAAVFFLQTVSTLWGPDWSTMQAGSGRMMPMSALEQTKNKCRYNVLSL